MLNTFYNIRFSVLNNLGLIQKTEKISGKYTKEKTLYTKHLLFQDDQYKRFLELKALINSDSFKEAEKSKEFKNSEEAKLIEEYKSIKKSKELKLFLKQKTKKTFKNREKYQFIIDDDFTTDTIDSNKWNTSHEYSNNHEADFKSEKNLLIEQGNLKLITQPETSDAKVWDPKYGFKKIERYFSSALINSKGKQSLKTGKLNAKIKGSALGVHTNLVLRNQKNDFYIYFSLRNNKVLCGTVERLKNGKIKNKQNNINLNSDSNFFLYSITVCKNKIIWKLNGTTVRKESVSNLNEEFYVEIDSFLPKTKKDLDQVAQTSIDWIEAKTLKL